MHKTTLNNLMNLTHVKRWTIVPMRREENVAEHSFRVAAIAEYLADRIEADDNFEGSLDRLMILRIALRHDLDEVFSGDVPTPCKPLLDTKKLAERIDNEIRHIKGMEKEYAIVKLADTLDTIWSLKLFGVPPYADGIMERVVASLSCLVNTPVPGLSALWVEVVVNETMAVLTTSNKMVPSWMRL